MVDPVRDVGELVVWETLVFGVDDDWEVGWALNSVNTACFVTLLCFWVYGVVSFRGHDCGGRNSGNLASQILCFISLESWVGINLEESEKRFRILMHLNDR